jgi:hypothetical protein
MILGLGLNFQNRIKQNPETVHRVDPQMLTSRVDFDSDDGNSNV